MWCRVVKKMDVGVQKNETARPHGVPHLNLNPLPYEKNPFVSRRCKITANFRNAQNKMA